MADPHQPHHGPIEGNIEAHPLKLAIGVIMGAFALIVGLILLVQFAGGLYAGRSMKDDPNMSPEEVPRRLAPGAQAAIDPNAPPPAPAAPAPAVASVTVPPAASKGAAPAAAGGKDVYDKVCTACHSAGVAGAPQYGDKAAWAARLKESKGDRESAGRGRV